MAVADIGGDLKQQGTASLGQNMLIAAWVGVALILSFFFSHQLEKRNNPNQHPVSTMVDGARQVELMRNAYGHYLASGQINGTEVDFLLDTGATTISVPGGLAQRLGLEQGPNLWVGTAAGPVTVQLTRLQQVTLGGITLHDVRAHINPHMDQHDVVLLGMSFLGKLDFRQEGDSLIIEQRVP